MHCTIQLAKGLENEEGLYRKRLQTDLAQFICPWLIRGTMNLGLQIRKNEVLSFINSRPYIKFVTRFSLVKIFETTDTQDTDIYGIKDTSGEIETTEILSTELPWSVFVPVAQHNIEFTKEEKYIPPAAAAIESMRLETGFLIVDDIIKPDIVPLLSPKDSTDEEWYLVPKST